MWAKGKKEEIMKRIMGIQKGTIKDRKGKREYRTGKNVMKKMWKAELTKSDSSKIENSKLKKTSLKYERRKTISKIIRRERK